LSLGPSPHRLSSSEAAFSCAGGEKDLGHKLQQKMCHGGWALQAVIKWAHFEGL